jgi:DNA-binding transcriptional regulator of glucitol operon
VRRLLHPRWLFWHVVVLVLFVVFVRLGFWQFHAAVRTHSPQNMGYALQWPFFALFGLAVWIRICRDAVRPGAAPKPRTQSRRPPPEPARPVPVTDEEDPELAAYNRYLAELNER